MLKLKVLIENKQRIIVFIFFALFLGMGLSIFQDYGVSFDEYFQRTIGETSLDYVVKGDKSLLTFRDKDYGPVFEIFLVGVERGLHLTDRPRGMIFVRHLVVFLLFFIAVIFFYQLCKYRFHDWKMGLLGSLFLILSPRIFADSFYNSKDIPFLSLFIISIYTLIKFIDKSTLSRAFIHALICALLIDIRIGGILVPFFTVIFIATDVLILKPMGRNGINTWIRFSWFVLFLVFFTVLFWPLLWKDPYLNFKGSIQAMVHFKRFYWPVFYLGDYVAPGNLPWHYVPVWIGISTPIIYTVFCLIGLLTAATSLLFNPVQFYKTRKYDLLFMGWFLLPVLTVIICRSVLYSGWRHMYFVYPAMLIFSLAGLEFIFEFFRTKLRGRCFQAARLILIMMIALNLINVIRFMVVNHPFQNIYFNIFAGLSREKIENKFELDYWGLSYRKALEYIVKNDADKVIKVYAPSRLYVALNACILNDNDQQRLLFVDTPQEAKYFLSNERPLRSGYPYKNEYYSIKVDGIKILVVYKM